MAEVRTMKFLPTIARRIALFFAGYVYPEILTGLPERGHQNLIREWLKTSHFLALIVNIAKTVGVECKLGLSGQRDYYT